ncbi:MAG TPA: hypothetical protein PL009_14120 [Flavipsychrobacter sp.]|nr:hypothetical protein [Flavipsychrobacter sp.]
MLIRNTIEVKIGNPLLLHGVIVWITNETNDDLSSFLRLSVGKQRI